MLSLMKATQTLKGNEKNAIDFMGMLKNELME